MELLDVHLVTAVSPPGSGRNEISPWFLRHLNVLSVDSFSDETLKRIFSAIVTTHFKAGFELAINQLSSTVVDASLKLYKSVLATFLPTPAKCHYMFNLRDFAKVGQKSDMMPCNHTTRIKYFIRWCKA